MVKNNELGIQTGSRAYAESRSCRRHNDSIRKNSGQCPVQTQSRPKIPDCRQIAGTPKPHFFRVENTESSCLP